MSPKLLVLRCGLNCVPPTPSILQSKPYPPGKCAEVGPLGGGSSGRRGLCEEGQMRSWGTPGGVDLGPGKRRGEQSGGREQRRGHQVRGKIVTRIL